MKKIANYLTLLLLLLLFSQCARKSQDNPELAKIELGKAIFFDKSLSNPPGQSCGSCHAINSGFADPDHSMVSGGIADGLFGNRNATSISYAMFSPALHYDSINGTWVGGQFWDGRVNTLEDQAKEPFFNPLEMNNTDVEMFAAKVKSSKFYNTLVKIYGQAGNSEKLLDQVADALAAFQRSPEVNPFTSKFDYYLKGEVQLTSLEMAGMLFFKDTTRAKCANCHLIEPDPVSGKVLFTDFSYDNIGVPRNKFNPFYRMTKDHNPYGEAFIDSGLYLKTRRPENIGQFKVPTMRNIAVTSPYLHNGIFGTLEEVVHFYNKRDVDPMFGPPEIKQNINAEELGNLGLTMDEERAIVAFLKTLTDGYEKD
jgi:cytochrome c peroxidase